MFLTLITKRDTPLLILHACPPTKISVQDSSHKNFAVQLLQHTNPTRPFFLTPLLLYHSHFPSLHYYPISLHFVSSLACLAH